MKALLENLFQLKHHNTTLGKESVAGVISFLSIVYIIAINSTILSDAGIPLEAGIFATVAVSVIGCLLMAFWANAPLFWFQVWESTRCLRIQWYSQWD